MHFIYSTNIFNHGIIIFIFSFLLSINCNIIVIPFSIKDIPKKQNQQYIYTSIEIGEPPKKIDSIINFSNSFFYFSNEPSINLTNSYNSSNSNTFNVISNINISSIPTDIKNLISEQFYFCIDINCVNKKKYILSPILFPNININEKIFPKIDLQINSANKSFNFIHILKSKKIIDNYYWTIKFHNFSNGEIIIGDLPHNYEKNNNIFKEKNLKFINTYSQQNKIFWGIQFTAIKFGEITMTDIMIGKIIPNILEIFGSYEYLTKIEELFFEKYKENFVCKRIFDEVNGEDVFRFTCDKNLFNKNDINLFPNLTLINVELNYSFVFTGEELFMEKNDKINFMIVTKIGRTEYEWDLGRIFLYKYQFVMDNDNNLIGIYKESEEEEEELPKQNNYILIIVILIIVLGFIFLALGIILALIKKNLCKNRKKRLSELDEDFIYLTKDKV